jgi:hypothetical protein
MSNKKQTAVEWLIDELLSGKILMPSLIDQAKAMEKEQIEDAYWEGGQYVPMSAKQCEQYYKETYEQ